MKFAHTGLFVSVLILIAILVTCHLRRYVNLYPIPKSDFSNLTIPTGTPPLQYNQILYSDQGRRIPCEIASQAHFPCSQIQTCQQLTQPQMELSESEIAVLYKLAYEQAGLEVLNRAL